MRRTVATSPCWIHSPFPSGVARALLRVYPLPYQLHAFPMHYRTPQLRHHHRRIVAVHAEHQHRSIGLAWGDVVQAIAGAFASRDRLFAETQFQPISDGRIQPHARSDRRSSLAMAVAAVDVQIGARTVVELGVRGVPPVGVARRLGWIGRTGQVTDAREMRDLVLAAGRISEIAI